MKCQKRVTSWLQNNVFLDFSSELKILFITYFTRIKWTHLEQSCRCLFQLWCWLKSSYGKTKIDWISNSIDKEFCRIWTGNWISERNYSKCYTDHLKELLTKVHSRLLVSKQFFHVEYWLASFVKCHKINYTGIDGDKMDKFIYYQILANIFISNLK